jgi:flagellar P-ring protein precursor FlgI
MGFLRWCGAVLLGASLSGAAATPRAATVVPPDAHMARLGDVMTVKGVRDNLLMGYGLVVGLNGTGDRQQTIFSMQTLANILRKMGVQVPGATILARNVGAVFVTANLPPFARPGEKIDVNCASAGDAKSLQGGVLLMTPLYGSDGVVYAVAQGPLTIAGYSVGTRGNVTELNHPTTGRIPNGALVERDTAIDLGQMQTVSLLLRDADFVTAENAADAINKTLGKSVATAVDGRRVDVPVAASGLGSAMNLLAKIEDVEVRVNPKARVVVNERTGTVVMGKDVTLGAASIMHGNLAIQITTVFQVSQPAALSPGGQTVVVPQTTVETNEEAAKRVELKEGATVEELVNGLQSIGATARDIIAILEALKAAGSLRAELEVI